MAEPRLFLSAVPIKTKHKGDLSSFGKVAKEIFIQMLECKSISLKMIGTLVLFFPQKKLESKLVVVRSDSWEDRGVEGLDSGGEVS